MTGAPPPSPGARTRVGAVVLGVALGRGEGVAVPGEQERAPALARPRGLGRGGRLRVSTWNGKLRPQISGK